MPPSGSFPGKGLLVLSLWIGLAGAAQSQTNTEGAIGGVISDPSGAAIQQADVSARNAENGAEFETRTDASGNYRFPALRPGNYALTVMQSDFTPFHVDRVVVEVGRLTDLSTSLTVLGRQETVVVREEAPQLDLNSPALATNLDEISINGLPINRRRSTDFVLLTPGVTSQEGSGLLNFRGISALLNNFTIDGADNNQAFFSEERGRTRIAYSTSQASVREFQVNTSNFSAEYGRAAGGVINTVTRSGTNRFHGDLFFYDRDSHWGARNPYTTLVHQSSTNVDTGNVIYSGVPVTPRDRREQWGLSVGGPIRHDKLFFFFTYDQHRRNFPGIARVGNVDGFFNKPLTSAELTTLAARLEVPLNSYAKIKYYQVLSGLAGETGVVPRSADQSILFPKLDWQPSDRIHFSLQYNRLRSTSPDGVRTQPSETYGVSSFGNDYVKGDWAVGRLNLFLRRNLMNEVRYQYGRDFESQSSQAPSAFELPLSNNPYNRAPEVSILGGSTGIHIGTPAGVSRAKLPDERRQQIVDTVTWVHGKHFVKAGYDFNHVNEEVDSLYNVTGTYVYDSLVNFVSDYLSPNRCGEGGSSSGFLPCYSYFRQQLGPQAYDFGTNDYAAFVSDEWKVRPGLTLSYGMRYEFQQLPHTNALLANPQLPQTANSPQDTNNFGPRLGVTWDPFGRGHTVLRAGYGIYYGRITNSTVFSALTNTGSAGGQLGYDFRPADEGAPPFPHVFAGRVVVPVAPDVSFFDKRFQNPQIHEMEASLGQQLSPATDLTVSFLESLGRELPNYVDTNIDTAAVGSVTYSVPDFRGPIKTPTYTTKLFTQRVNPNYGKILDIFSETNSHYEAGVLKLRHRMQRYFHLQASYTYAHAWDGHQSQSNFTNARTVLDPSDIHAEYGRSNFDIRQRVTGSAILQEPKLAHSWLGVLVNGYAAAPVVTLQSGRPFSLHTGGSTPYLAFSGQLNTVQRLRGLGSSINGSGGDNRIAEIGRNTFRYPGTIGVDLRLSKETPIGEHMRFQLQGEVFNVLNHQNITHIDTVGYYISNSSKVGGAPTLTYNPYFNTPVNSNSTTFNRERQIQLVGRLRF